MLSQGVPAATRVLRAPPGRAGTDARVDVVVEETVEIIRGHMVHLGYGRFWRSDEIVGLSPIEEGRGPGRRTEVYVHGRSEPIVASRTERSILQDMVHAEDEEFAANEARDVMRDLLEDVADVPEVLRRLLMNEVGLDLRAWERRLSALLVREPGNDPEDGQEDLFSTDD